MKPIENQLFALPALPVPSPDTVLPDLTQHLWLEQIPAPRYLGLHSVCLIEVSGSARVGDWQPGHWLDSRYLNSQSTYQRSRPSPIVTTHRGWFNFAPPAIALWCCLSCHPVGILLPAQGCVKTRSDPVCFNCLLKSIVFHGAQTTVVNVIIVITSIIIVLVVVFVKAFTFESFPSPHWIVLSNVISGFLWLSSFAGQQLCQ
jgi:hypothetical protein